MADTEPLFPALGPLSHMYDPGAYEEYDEEGLPKSDKEKPRQVPFQSDTISAHGLSVASGLGADFPSPVSALATMFGWNSHDTISSTQDVQLETESTSTEQEPSSYFSWLPSFSWPFGSKNTPIVASKEPTPVATKGVSRDQDVQFIEEAHERAIEQIRNASIDNITAIFFAQAFVNHTVGAALSRLNQKTKEWSHDEARRIKGSHDNTWAHTWNIGGGAVQGGVGVVALIWQAAFLKGAGDVLHTEVMKLQVFQQSGSAIGSTIQQGYTYCNANNEAIRAEAQSHQGALSTDRSTAGQETSAVKQSATDALRKAGEAIQAKDQAFNSLSR